MRFFDEDQPDGRAGPFRRGPPWPDVEVQLVHMHVAPALNTVQLDGLQRLTEDAHSGPHAEIGLLGRALTSLGCHPTVQCRSATARAALSSAAPAVPIGAPNASPMTLKAP